MEYVKLNKSITSKWRDVYKETKNLQNKNKSSLQSSCQKKLQNSVQDNDNVSDIIKEELKQFFYKEICNSYSTADLSVCRLMIQTYVTETGDQTPLTFHKPALLNSLLTVFKEVLHSDYNIWRSACKEIVSNSEYNGNNASKLKANIAWLAKKEYLLRVIRSTANNSITSPAQSSIEQDIANIANPTIREFVARIYERHTNLYVALEGSELELIDTTIVINCDRSEYFNKLSNESWALRNRAEDMGLKVSIKRTVQIQQQLHQQTKTLGRA